MANTFDAGSYFNFLALAAAFLLLSSLVIDWKDQIVRKVTVLNEKLIERIFDFDTEFLESRITEDDISSQGLYKKRLSDLLGYLSREISELQVVYERLVTKVNKLLIIISFILFFVITFVTYKYSIDKQWVYSSIDSVFAKDFYSITNINIGEINKIEKSLFFIWFTSSILSLILLIYGLLRSLKSQFKSFNRLLSRKSYTNLVFSVSCSAIFLIVTFYLNIKLYSAYQWVFFLYPFISYLSIIICVIVLILVRVNFESRSISRHL